MLKERSAAEIQRLEVERWARKNSPEQVRLALQAVGEEARKVGNVKRWVIIPLKVIGDDLKDVLLADLAVAELQQKGFGVYCRRSGKAREYCVTWGKDLKKPPDGFEPIIEKPDQLLKKGDG